MFNAVMAIAAMLLVLGAAVLVLFAGFRVYDLIVLAFLAMVATFLSRFNSYFDIELLGRPYVGFHWFILIALVGLLGLRGLTHHRPALGLSSLVLLASAFAVLSLVSGLLNGGQVGLSAAVQVLVISLPPLLVAMLIADLAPRTPEAAARLRLTYILLIGVLIPLITIITSLAPNVLGSFLGWSSMMTASKETGFVRGWSPLGSSGSTGLVMVLAYALAMHEVIGHRKRVYIIVLFLVGLAILFMLARAVLVMFLLFHLIYFSSAIRRSPGRVFGLAIVCAAIGVPVVMELRERYNFERFGLVGGDSDQVRASSALAAIEASTHNPLLGRGPGLLYEEIRTDWIMPTIGGPVQKITVIENRDSAMEPHNTYLLLAAEHGWPAALAFCAIMFLIWRRVRSGRRSTDAVDRSMATAWSAGWLSAGAMLLTASTPLVNPQTATFFWMFAFIGLHWRATMVVEESEAEVWAAQLRPVHAG